MAVNAYLFIDGVEGPSTSKAGHIDVLSFSWGVSQQSTYGAGASGKEAKEVTFTKFASKAGKTIVSEMEIRDLLARDPKAFTRVEYLDYRPAKLDDKIFTPEGAKGI